MILRQGIGGVKHDHRHALLILDGPRRGWRSGAVDEDLVKQTRHVEAALPFAILGFDCDNGGEFINHYLVDHFARRRKPVQFTRCRPYK